MNRTYAMTVTKALAWWTLTLVAGCGVSGDSEEGTATAAAAIAEAGLRGEYFDNSNFTRLITTRVDPRVDFNWGTGRPDPNVYANEFSVRWSGFVTPLYSEDTCGWDSTNGCDSSTPGNLVSEFDYVRVWQK